MTKITKSNVDAAMRDDAAHIDYLKRDVLDDQKYGGKYKDENQTADEKHISKLAGDMKYDKKHHSPAGMYESAMDFNPALRAAEQAGKLNEGFAKVVRDDAAGKMKMGEGMPFLGIGKKKSMPDFDYEDPNYKESRQYKRFERKQKRQAKRAARKAKRNAAAEMHCMGKKK